MSYLMLPDGIPDLSKAVISFWFRIPQASLDAARAQGQEAPENIEGDINNYFPALFGIIPLVTFGSVEAAITDKGHGTGATPTSPSFVGVDCTSRTVPEDKNSLAVHLAMPSNSTFVMTPMDSDGAGDLSEPQFISSLQRKEAFYMGGKGGLPYAGGELSVLDVTADAWHHILISFDLSMAAVMTYSTATRGPPPIVMAPGGPTFMWAFDDMDKTDYSLFPSCAQVYNTLPPGSTFTPPPALPLNKITTNNLISIAGGSHAFIGTWSPVPIKTSDNPVGIPATAKFVDNIYKVEMAEFQMFTGVTLDTGIEANRRMFISAKGFPVDPARTDSFTLTLGDPTTWEGGGDDIQVPPLVPEPNAPIGKRSLGLPVVAFTRDRQNWIGAVNLGSARGKVTKTGKIKAYHPDPQLGK
jgi:hypothetical protein